MTYCDKCSKKASLKYHYLSKPNEFYFCDEHGKQFVEVCNAAELDYIRGTL